MTANEMLPAIGQAVTLSVEKIRIAAHVLDVKFAYGRALLLVTPDAGSGQQWVDLSRISMRSESDVQAIQLSEGKR